MSEVVVCSLYPVKEIYKVQKPSFCKEKSIPYVSWGYGLTPTLRDKTLPILAMEWDKVIQLAYVDD